MSPSHHSNVPSLPPYLTPLLGGPHRALFIPDILQSILEHVVQPSLDDLKHRDLSRMTSESVYGARVADPVWIPRNIYGRKSGLPAWVYPLLVCRCWYHVAQTVIFRCATSKPDKLSFTCPSRFPHPLLDVVRLEFVGFARDYFENFHDHVDPLLAQLDHLLSKSNSPSSSQLRELSMVNLSPTDYLPRIFNIAPLQTHLTLLELSCDGNLPAHLLLSSAYTPGLSSTPLPNLRHLLVQGAYIIPFPTDFVQDSTFCLVTLRLDQVWIQRDTLHTLLLCVAGPALKQLALRFEMKTLEELLPPTFLDTWAPLCTGLDWFEISGSESQRNVLTLHSSRGLVPQIQWFEWLDIPSTTDARFTIDFQMSILDISGERIYDQKISRLIHQFLCSKDANFLREVVIPAIPFNTAIFDPTWDHANEISPQPWTCTAVQKLVVSFSLPQYTDEKMAPWRIHCSSAQHSKASRIACGFIVTSCPNLVRLDINFNDKAFDLDTEGGLCFLGRLQHLEHLVWRQMNGLTQSFPIIHLDAARRHPWPYDKSHWNALVQKQKVAIPWFTGSGTKNLSLPVLRWMSTEPTDDDRKRKWTNLSRCRHLYRMDNDIFQTAKLTIQGRRKRVGLTWQSMLESMLADKKAREGACWDRLQTLTCHVGPYDCGQFLVKHMEKGAFCNAFIDCYSKELQKVLPRVEIQFNIKQ